MDKNYANRTLYHADNLPILRGMNSETVDLIATDPPFNKNRDFHATPDSLAAGARFEDRWAWDRDVQPEWLDAIQDDWPQAWFAIDNARMVAGEDMGAFLCWLGVRLMEMHRVLKPTGSIYLHIDHTAHAYVKTLMDAIFGRANFRNGIVWKSRQDKGNLAVKQMVRAHDLILWYAKSETAVYNVQFLPYDDAYLQASYRHQDGRGHYRLLPCTNETGGNKVYDFRGIRRAWRFAPETMQQMYDDGMLYQASPSSPWQYKKYLADAKGVKVEDLWSDIPGARGLERMGYPTQKPLALYERIIKASSNAGDLVLDPFAGCATTPVAAERLGRQWVAIDIWDGALGIVHKRMEDNRQLLADIPVVRYETAPPRAHGRRQRGSARPHAQGADTGAARPSHEQCGHEGRAHRQQRHPLRGLRPHLRRCALPATRPQHPAIAGRPESHLESDAAMRPVQHRQEQHPHAGGAAQAQPRERMDGAPYGVGC